MKLVPVFILLLISITASAQNSVYTFAGQDTAGLRNGEASQARFNNPSGMCRDKAGNIYVVDNGNSCIRKIDRNGTISTYAGTTVPGYKDGTLLSAQFNGPFCMCIDEDDNIYVADFMGQRIRKITFAGTVSTVAGNGTAGYKDGEDTIAQFNYPRGIVIDKQGNLYVADSWNHRVRKIDAVSHAVTTYAGGGEIIGVQSVGDFVDAADTTARFYTPSGLAIDNEGNIFVADAFNHRIRKIDTARNVTTVAGSGDTGQGNGSFAEGHAITIAKLNTPTDLYWDSNGLLISDTYNNRIRLLSGGMLSTFAGTGNEGYKNGDATAEAEFDFPRGVIINETFDSIWVADSRNNVIRLICSTFQSGIENTKSFYLDMYPNPVQSMLAIVLPSVIKVYNVSVTDMLGRVVYTNREFNEGIFTYSTNDLKNGLYIVNITSACNNYMGRFVK